MPHKLSLRIIGGKKKTKTSECFAEWEWAGQDRQGWTVQGVLALQLQEETKARVEKRNKGVC